MKILIHGYGLLSEDRQNSVAGSKKMSGLALYNSLLFEGLRKDYDVAFFSGRLSHVQGILDKKRLPTNELLLEYDARFCDLLEKNGKFEFDLARKWYCKRVDDLSNPIYQQIASAYSKVLNYFQPDVLNLHNLNAASSYVHRCVKRSNPRPIAIATIHDTNPEQLKFIAKHQDFFDRFVAISQVVVDELQMANIEPDKIELIPNGLDLEPFLNASRKQWHAIAYRENIPDDDAIQVLVPARRVPEKGIEFAIEAFAKFLKTVDHPARLLISGAGMADEEYQERLYNFTKEQGCSHSVFFLKPIAYNEMPALYAACDVSVVPSVFREGFCYSNIEAMATGGPVVITTEQGGCLDYIIHKCNGIFVPVKDSTAIADFLLDILNHPDTASRIRQEAQLTAKKYTVQAMIAAYSNILEGIAAIGKVA